MKKLIVLLSTMVGLVVTAAAQQEAPAKLAPTAEENSLLWEISGQGLAAPSYLFGTIHMINKKDFILGEQTVAAFDKAELVTFEINLEEMTNMAVIMPLMMKAFMKGDTTLQDLLDEEDYQTVSAHFEKIGLPMMFIDRIKPMFLSALGSEDALQLQGNSSEVVSYEMEFMNMARKQGKAMSGLETAEYQMSMFDSIPYRVQAEMLIETIEAGDASDDQFQQLVELYKAQNLYGLQQMLASEEAGVAEYEDLLLNQRNRNWIPIMEEMMADRVTFFAVGAGHLAGEQGVIALLRRQGYTVRPLR